MSVKARKRVNRVMRERRAVQQQATELGLTRYDWPPARHSNLRTPNDPAYEDPELMEAIRDHRRARHLGASIPGPLFMYKIPDTFQIPPR